MNELIEEITEIKNESGHDGYGHDGYIVKTDKQSIDLFIDNGQCCCEDWGYFMSEDSLDNYIGARLLGVSVTDPALESVDLDERTEVYEGGVMFVTFKTDRGTFQFVAYNEHNGYYSHEAGVISMGLTHSEYL